MNENNRYFYGYDNENCFKKENKCCHMKEEQYYPKKDNKYYPKKEEQYYPSQENKHQQDDRHQQDNKHRPDRKPNQCCCKNDIRRALEILSSDRIREFINFDAAAFITDFFIAGTTLETIGEGDHDNLGDLTGSLDKLSPCECDFLQISGVIIYPNFANDTLNTDIEARLASLCTLKAIALGVNTTPETTLENYNAIRRALRFFNCNKEDCNPKCDDCCCGDGVRNEVANGNLSGRASLTAGSLALIDVDVLACIGNVLILGAPPTTPAATDAMIYVVCTEAVQFII